MSVSSTSNYSLCVPFDLDPMPVITIAVCFYILYDLAVPYGCLHVYNEANRIYESSLLTHADYRSRSLTLCHVYSLPTEFNHKAAAKSIIKNIN